ncbi:MAG: hypothetical protein ACW97P_12305 [Candidatus Hodarchaeales archaeon]|jgi:hypothetical protein
MKIIVQMKPDQFEQTLFNISEEQMDQYEVDIETYGYFHYEIFEKQFQVFVENKTGKTRSEIVGFIPNPNDGAKQVEAMYNWQKKTSKYLKEFHKKRSKYYLYKGSIFSYTFIGYGNVGHVIEIIKYDTKDLLHILNSFSHDSNSIFSKVFKI